jgi:hypothetical protein
LKKRKDQLARKKEAQLISATHCSLSIDGFVRAVRVEDHAIGGEPFLQKTRVCDSFRYKSMNGLGIAGGAVYPGINAWATGRGL